MKHLKLYNESLTNVGNLKNAVQVMNWIEIDSNDYLRELIMKTYRYDLNGSDTYIRYYPNDRDEDYIKTEDRELINSYLVEQGFFVDPKNEMFYVLIRIDW